MREIEQAGPGGARPALRLVYEDPCDETWAFFHSRLGPRDVRWARKLWVELGGEPEEFREPPS